MVIRIPKKWKWCGELFISTAAEPVCTVTITDTTDHLPEGLRFSVLFSSIDSIRLQKLYSTFEVGWILRACTPIQQLGKLAAESYSDEQKHLTKFLTKEQKVRPRTGFKFQSDKN
jgi:hypothetical protein